MAATPSSTAQSRLASSSLYNSDLAPVPAERRTWSTYNYSALWISMSVNILTYMLAASLIQGGMDWKQALATAFAGGGGPRGGCGAAWTGRRGWPGCS